MKARLHETSILHEVPFHDVDLTRRVWHGHYYKYLELARTALFRAHGLDDDALIPKRFMLYVVETRCRYTFPLCYREQMRVSAWFLGGAPALGRLRDHQPEPGATRGPRPHDPCDGEPGGAPVDGDTP